MVGWHHRLHGLSLGKLQELVMDRETWHAAATGSQRVRHNQRLTDTDCLVSILSCISCLYILEINPLSVTSFANILFHSRGCLFVWSMVSFAVQELLSLIWSHLFIFVFIFITLRGGSEKILLQYMSMSGLPMFSSKFYSVCPYIQVFNLSLFLCMMLVVVVQSISHV